MIRDYCNIKDTHTHTHTPVCVCGQVVTPVAKPVDKNNKKEKKQDKGGGGGGGGGSKEVSITKVILPHLFTHRTNTGTFITSQFVTNGKSNPHFLSHSLLTLIVFFSSLFSAPAEPVARIHPRAPQPLRGAEEGERRPACKESPRQQVHHRGAARRT